MDPDRFLYHFFSGKGGVGKTTLAAATSVLLARNGRRVLITSTDPAHSLSDVFDRTIGHEGCDIEPGLRALEVDSSLRWQEATAAATQGESPASRSGRIERAVSSAMRLLGDAPGVDEFISLDLLLETMSSRAYDTVVFDTAPTGHTLRLLLLPEMLDGWIGRMLTLRSYFSRFGRALRKLVSRGAKELPDLGDGLQAARDQVGRARDLLADPLRTHFALVTIPEALSVLETQRTLLHLRTHGIRVGMLIANQVQPPSDSCEHCRLRHEIHQKELGAIRSIAADAALRIIPSKARIIRGPDALHELGRELWDRR